MAQTFEFQIAFQVVALSASLIPRLPARHIHCFKCQAFMQPYRNCQLARPCSFWFLFCSRHEFHLSVFLANSALARIHCFNDQLFTCSALMAPVPARA